jgi:hypothetical protein
MGIRRETGYIPGDRRISHKNCCVQETGEGTGEIKQARELISSYKLSSYLEQAEGLKGVNTQKCLLISTYTCSMGPCNSV